MLHFYIHRTVSINIICHDWVEKNFVSCSKNSKYIEESEHVPKTDMSLSSSPIIITIQRVVLFNYLLFIFRGGNYHFICFT